tara:strand:+ start:327 stop:602 length:276 start_codon:yes stop_codon:yes gene_type:complete
MLSVFEEAVKFVSTHRGFDVNDEERLMIYALYKMATVGKAPDECECSSLDMKGKMKYNAWKELSSNYGCGESAKTLYVELVNKLIIKYKSE